MLTLFVLETTQHAFIGLKQIGDKKLEAYEIEELYNAQLFDKKEEIKAFEKFLNEGDISNPLIRSDWTVTINDALLPVRVRTLLVELKPPQTFDS